MTKPEWPDKQSFSWQDIERVVDAALERTVAFHRVFATLAGGALPGLFLSQVYFYSRQPGTIENGGWFYKSREQWEEETALTRAEQETARKQLKSRNLLEEKLEGLPRRLYYRLPAENFYRALVAAAQAGGDKITDLPAKQTRGGKPDRRAGNKITRKQDTKSPALMKEDVPTDAQEKQQQTPVDEPDGSVVDALKDFGFDEEAARNIASSNVMDAERVRLWAAYAGKAPGIKNPRGFVRKKLVAGAVPPGHVDPQTAQASKEAQQAAKRATVAQRRQSVAAVYDVLMNGFAESYRHSVEKDYPDMDARLDYLLRVHPNEIAAAQRAKASLAK